MIQDEAHPAMVRAHHDLLGRLGRVLGNGRLPLDRSLLEKLFGVIKDHRDSYRTQGLDFPVLVALVIQRLGVIEFVRADLDIASIRVKVVNFVREHKTASMEEVAAAFRGAYPDLKSDDILAGQQSGIQADARQQQRIDRVIEDFGGEDKSKPN